MAFRASVLLLVLGCLVSPGCTPPQGEDASHPLVGKKAPLFSASFLDGAPYDLAQHLGTDVIILDFWATWCGPCREALPTLTEVAGEYQDRGVRFFAVDLGESAEEVQAFLDQSSLPLSVLMDKDGSIADSYGVDAIPQTVIIDRQGTVRFVHVGVAGDLRARLGRELNELVSEPTAKAEPTAQINQPSLPSS